MVLQTVRVPFGTVSRYSFECVDILAEGVDLQSEVLESLVIAVISRLSIHNTDLTKGNASSLFLAYILLQAI